ncbi:MAG TPA: alpha-ketoglutarate-dependent dioxygenase AlkB [Lacipirellulaceae bacterium]|nr:alpha-ketoglutarate-dependent dioxygenase AlkB [Lacipirellulaceae bacterium]
MLLFDSTPEPALPNIGGLRYWPDFIDQQVEAALVSEIDAAPWDETWERRRQPYGRTYGGGTGQTAEIPSWARELAKRIATAAGEPDGFDQVLVNEYLPGQGIALHCDYEPFDRTVASLSLLSQCVMDLRHAADGRRAEILLEPRSLLVLSDEARYAWMHGIARRKNDRWAGARAPRRRRLSVTFRRYKDAPQSG